LQGVEIYCSDYKKLIPINVQRDDFVYFDPPYVPLSAMSDFTAYTKEGFGLEDQETLAAVVWQVDQLGAHFLLSNAGSDKVRRLYVNCKIEEVLMRRNINSKASLRGEIVEYLVSRGNS
jgi:DNA adenine methylase